MRATEQKVDIRDADTSIGMKLRLRRKAKGLALKDVAQESRISVAQLSQIERGISAPSIRSLKQICAALDMPMGWLFDHNTETNPADQGVVIRKHERRILDLSGKGIIKEMLTPDECPQIQMMLIIVQPQGGSGDDPYNNAEGAKCGTVLEGVLGLELDGEVFELGQGDSFAFDARRMVRFWCVGDRPTKVIWTCTPSFY